MGEGRPGRGSDQFPLRMPNGMRQRIKLEAEMNGRSMNAEIVEALEDKFPSKPDLDDIRRHLQYLMDDIAENNDDKLWRAMKQKLVEVERFVANMQSNDDLKK